MAEIVITTENFEQEVLKATQPVLVDFWATWCGPCKMLAPVIEELEEELNGVLKVGKINVDNEPELAVKFGIVSIPTVLIFKDGEVVQKSVGFTSKEHLKALLDI